MKLDIITLHRVYNYGSALQAYATQRIFEKHGFEVEVIDYITPQRTLKRKIFGNKIQGFFGIIHFLFKPFSIVLKEKTFGNFVKNKLNLTRKYIDFDDLKKDPPIADIYVTGSDQTWNSNYNEGVDEGFFLNFVDSMNKYAFVASFGKDSLDDSELAKTKALLSKYKAISVREKQGLKILDGLGIKNGVCLIDPTLQITKEEWLKLSSKRLVKENYVVLMLLYNEDNGATEYARKLANDRGLKLVKISWEFKKPKKVDKLFTHRKPADFLSLFNYADFVVTNSFHGLAFSINLNKQFIVVPRNEFNNRIDNLLSIVGLNNRLVHSFKELDYVKDEFIDFKLVNDRIEQERLKADRFISDNFPNNEERK